jgi:hypothetical protein
MKKFVLLLLVSFQLVAQTRYEYVIVPEKFDFSSKKNPHNLSDLTKSFFESEGYKVFLESEIMPNEVANNRCKSLYVYLLNRSKLFNRSLIVQLKDCNGNVLLESTKGTSYIKEHKRAFNEALRFALTPLRGKTKLTSKVTENVVNNQTTKESTFNNTSSIKLQTERSNEKSNSLLIFFAIPTQTGYKLVDDVPNVIFELTKSSSPDIFMAKKGNLQGLLIKKENNWFFEYNNGNQLVSEKVEVKF